MNFLRRSLPAALALFLVNVYITLRLFHTEFTRQIGSIEAVYIGLARYIQHHFPDLNWFPLWYGGIPFPDAYPPLMHFVDAALASAGHVPPGLAYHFTSALVFAITPVAVYWTACKLGASRLAAFAGALGYSLFSPTAWLAPEVRRDAGGWTGPHRAIVLVRWGEGPHLISILFLVLAIGLLHVALERRKPVWYVAAACAVAATVLSNWIGAFALALAVAAYLLSYARLLRAAAIGAYAYALAMPWATPGTIRTIRANAPLVGGKFEPGPWHWAAVAAFVAGMVLLAWMLRRAAVPRGVRFGALFLYGTAFISLGGWWFHFRLLPQPERYHMEMDLAFWMALALLAAPLSRLVRGYRRRAIVAAALAFVLLPVIVHQRRITRELEKPLDIRTTAEYKISTWLGEHLPGARIFAPGTIAFWMNAFSDTPLLDGGFDNGMRNTFLQDVNFQILFGDKLQVALDWLEAFGCQAVVGGDPQSTEVYHPYNHPDKFHGLPEIWRDGPEVIYGVPWRRRSLAHAVRASDLVQKRPPPYDSADLKPYLAALEDPALPAADFQWRGSSAAVIAADLRPEHVLSVQVTYDEGWNARVQGQPRPVWGDKLGQLVVEPRCSGPCTVELFYDGGGEMRAARWIQRAAVAGGILWVLIAQVSWRKRSGLTKMN